tara:strand:- start:399 stop:818 length:420 start_codon:yes stop_codon:yes gene_type:complete
MWNKGDWVVVIGGTFSKSGDLKKVSFTIASVVEEGLDDLLVLPKEAYTSRCIFVPKKSCQKIPVQKVEVYEETRKPQHGDLVFYYEKNWNKKEVKAVSHVWELRNDPGSGVCALITVEDKQIWVPVENLLVLDVNNTEK